MKPSYFFLSLMNGAPRGGSEELWYKTALYLAKQGYKIGCAVFDWPQKENKLKVLEAAGCKVYRLPNKRLVKGKGLVRFLQKRQSKMALGKMVSSLPFDQYKLTIVNQGGFEVYTTPWKTLFKRISNYALLFHNYTEEGRFTLAQKTHLTNWISNASANFFAANRAIQMLETQLQLKIKNALVIINPITFPLPKQITPYPDFKSETVVFSMFAALDVYRKAQDKLVHVFAQEKWKSRQWILNLYGAGSDKEQLQNLIIQRQLHHRIFLQGHTDDVAHAIEQSHLILQITNVDAMPLSVMEAMAMSRPLIVSSVGDMPLWVQENVNGWICKASINEMDICLENAWENRYQWKEMATQSYLLFRKKFPERAEERFANQLVSLLDESFN